MREGGDGGGERGSHSAGLGAVVSGANLVRNVEGLGGVKTKLLLGIGDIIITKG